MIDARESSGFSGSKANLSPKFGLFTGHATICGVPAGLMAWNPPFHVPAGRRYSLSAT
jgi:hypothetical protein